MSIVPRLPFRAPPLGDAAKLLFTGRPEEFSALLTRGVMLAIATFGFHRFWLVTDLRRHLWANTRVGPDAFEYTGTARELLTGFLMALAVLVPFKVALTVLGLVAEAWQALSGFAFLAFGYLFAHYAAFRARRYRATRTVFRGLRFFVDGSAAAYAARAALWDALTVLSLGLAYPWRAAALERYRMRHTRYGSLRGDFTGTGWSLFKQGWWIWAIGLLGVAGPVAALAAERLTGKPSLWGLTGLLLLAVPFLYPVFLAVQTRWHLEGLRLGPVALETTLRKGTIYACYLRLALASMALSTAAGLTVLATLSFGMSLARRGGTPDLNLGSLLVLGLAAAFTLTLLAGYGALKRYFVLRGLWVAVAASSAAAGVAALDGTLAAGQAAGSLGEGLADAFDVGAF